MTKHMTMYWYELRRAFFENLMHSLNKMSDGSDSLLLLTSAEQMLP